MVFFRRAALLLIINWYRLFPMSRVGSSPTIKPVDHHVFLIRTQHTHMYTHAAAHSAGGQVPLLQSRCIASDEIASTPVIAAVRQLVRERNAHGDHVTLSRQRTWTM